MERIAINAGHVRRERLDDRDYLVAPMTILKEGVLAGSQGSLYYPASEIAKNPGVWNHVPLTIYHPTDDGGNPTSARSPAVISKYGVGYVFNDRYDPQTGQRHAEAWFDEQKLQRVENRMAESRKGYDPVLPRLLNGQPVELSTGLFTQNDLAANGSNHNGKGYTHVARDYRPDHLAVLPDQVGACSLKDGCGLLRNGLCENCGGKGGKPGPCPTQEGNDDDDDEHPVRRSLISSRYVEGSDYSADDKSSIAHSSSERAEKSGSSYDHLVAKESHQTASSAHKDAALKDDTDTADDHYAAARDHDFAASYHHEKSRGMTSNKCKHSSLGQSHWKAAGRRKSFTENTMNKDEAIQHLTTNCDCWKNKKDVLTNLDEETVIELAEQDQELSANRLVVNAAKETFGDIALNEMPAAFANAKIPPTPPTKKPKPGCEEDEPAMNTFQDFLKLPPEQRLTENERRAIDFANGIEAKYRSDLLDFVVNAVSSDKAQSKAVRDIYEKMSTKELETLKGTLPQRPVGNQERQAELPLLINWMGNGFYGHQQQVNNRVNEDDVLVLPTSNAKK